MKKYYTYIFVIIVLLLLFWTFYIWYKNKSIKNVINWYFKLNIETNIKDSAWPNF